MLKVRSAKKFETAKKRGKLISKAKPFIGYDLFEFTPEHGHEEAQKSKYDLYLNGGGDARYVKAAAIQSTTN